MHTGVFILSLPTPLSARPSPPSKFLPTHTLGPPANGRLRNRQREVKNLSQTGKEGISQWSSPLSSPLPPRVSPHRSTYPPPRVELPPFCQELPQTRRERRDDGGRGEQHSKHVGGDRQAAQPARVHPSLSSGVRPNSKPLTLVPRNHSSLSNSMFCFSRLFPVKDWKGRILDLIGPATGEEPSCALGGAAAPVD